MSALHVWARTMAMVSALALGACDSAAIVPPGGGADGGAASDGGGAASDGGGAASDGGGAGCAPTASTTASGVASPSGCAVLTRDTSACQAARTTAGLSGFWLRFSCRVSLTKPNGAEVLASADGLPDYRSNYYRSSDACWESYTAAVQNPNVIAAGSYLMRFPLVPDTVSSTMRGGIVGLALNGVPIFGNFAAPGDDIFTEARTFDRCGAHPQMTGQYHYHGEPYAISYDDAAFIGVMRDGYPIYGRRDADGTLPTLDSFGGHTGPTADSGGVGVYHYHLNLQTSTAAGTTGQQQWFLTKGSYRGAPGACTGC